MMRESIKRRKPSSTRSCWATVSPATTASTVWEIRPGRDVVYTQSGGHGWNSSPNPIPPVLGSADRKKTAFQYDWNAVGKSQNGNTINRVPNLDAQDFAQSAAGDHLPEFQQLAGRGDIPLLHGLDVVDQFTRTHM